MNETIERIGRASCGISPTIAALKPSLIGEVSKHGFGKPDVLPLWFGESDQTTPDFICDAASAALKAGQTFYTYNTGIPALRAALAAYETRLHAKPVDADRILVTSAGMQGILLTMQTLLEPGDSVLVVSPVWPNIRAAVEIHHGVVRDVALGRTADGGFFLDLAALADAVDARTRAIFVNSPSNPTGWVMNRAEMAALYAFARDRGLWLVADEVYNRIVFDGDAAPSFLDLVEPDDRVIVVNSFSKNWAMTGWRLGWLVVPPDLIQPLAKLVQFNTSGTAAFIQYAGVAAIEQGDGFIARMNAQYRANRDLVMAAFQDVPRVQLRAPDGAFYAFLAVDGMADSVAFAIEILEKTNVGVAPGAAFGLGGEGHLRLCFAASSARLEPALARLSQYLR